MRRRSFIKGAVTAVGGGLLAPQLGEASSLIAAQPGSVPVSDELSENDSIPDTLDLADRGALSINALTGAADPQRNYETYLSGHLVFRPANMSNMNGFCLAKPVHALPNLRVMSGSKQNADHDMKMLEACTNEVEDDGLYWLKIKDRPWRAKSSGEPGGNEAGHDLFCVLGQSRLMVALIDCYSKYYNDPKWLDLAGKMSDGMAKIAMQNDDLAWYHYVRHRSGWPGSADPNGDPDPTHAGGGGFIFTDGHPLRAFSRWYAVSGDKKALDMAQRLTRFLLRPEVWGNGEGPTTVDETTHALWRGHYHSHSMGMAGMLEYALATNDARVAQFVVDFYTYSRNFGISRIGWFPCFAGPINDVQQNCLTSWGAKTVMMEGCDIGDMTFLATHLSTAGFGDYWEDIDMWVRNQLVEYQMIDKDKLEEIVAGSPAHKIDPDTETDDNVIERNVGAFMSSADPTVGEPWWTMCCNANCAFGGLYSAWKTIVQTTGDVSRVNLLLNRNSVALDVASYLPYEGKVVIRNKTSSKVYVRVPRWANKKAVRGWVNHAELSLTWFGDYIVVDRLQRGDKITVTFPMVETVEKYKELTSGIEYTIRLRGNTVVDISPRSLVPLRPKGVSDAGSTFGFTKGYPLYQRDFYKQQTKTPMKQRPRYVPTVEL
jgi:hypothetical protein